MNLNGIEVRSSPFATQRKLCIEHSPIKKRRRAWRLVWRDKPTAYMVNASALGLGRDFLAMHPDLFAQLRTTKPEA